MGQGYDRDLVRDTSGSHTSKGEESLLKPGALVTLGLEDRGGLRGSRDEPFQK